MFIVVGMKRTKNDAGLKKNNKRMYLQRDQLHEKSSFKKYETNKKNLVFGKTR